MLVPFGSPLISTRELSFFAETHPEKGQEQSSSQSCGDENDREDFAYYSAEQGCTDATCENEHGGQPKRHDAGTRGHSSTLVKATTGIEPCLVVLSTGSWCWYVVAEACETSSTPSKSNPNTGSKGDIESVSNIHGLIMADAYRIDLHQQRTVGQILSATVALYRRYPLLFAVLALMVVAPYELGVLGVTG